MKIKLISPERDRAESWALALKRSDGRLGVEALQQTLRATNVLVNGSRPDIVVAEAQDAADLASLEQLAARHPEIDYVLVSGAIGQDVLMRMMRAGVREVLTAPATPDEVEAAVQRLLRKRSYAPAAMSSNTGRVLSFISTKGGSGSTFVAANAAHLLAEGGKRRVALIDLNLQFGDALLFVSSEQPKSNVAEVARNVARLDRDLLQSAMLMAAPGLWVLASPEDPALSAEVQAEHVQAIIKVARENFDYVVLDLGRSLSGVTLQALDDSDQVNVVLQLTLPFIRDGKRLRDVFRSLDYGPSKIQWIVNRYQKDSQITLDDLKRTLGADDLVVLPNNYQVAAASVNQGVPVAEIGASSPITRALEAFVDRLTPGAAAKQRSGGWLSGLLRNGARA